MRRRTAKIRLSSPIDFRLAILGLVFIAAWGAIGYRLFQVQVVHAAEYEAAGLAQRIDVQVLAARRGRIFDRQGRELAISIPATSVYAKPHQIIDPATTADCVGGDARRRHPRASRQTASLIRDSCSSPANSNEPRQMKCGRSNCRESTFLEESKRVYPSGSIAAHVVGFVDIDSNGIEGLELEYDGLLVGVPGSATTEQDPGGHVIPYGQYQVDPAVQGVDLITTIDLEVQFAAETACAEALIRTQGTRCTIVVLDPTDIRGPCPRSLRRRLTHTTGQMLILPRECSPTSQCDPCTNLVRRRNS